MSVFSQDNDYLYIELSQLPTPSYPSHSQPVQLFEQVLQAFSQELSSANISFELLSPIVFYKLILNSEITKQITVVTLLYSPDIEFDPDSTI